MPSKKFSGTLKAIGDKGAWTELSIPASISRSFGTRDRFKAHATIGGVAFPGTTLFPDGDGGFRILFNKAMQRGTGAKAGDRVEVLLKLEPRVSGE
jgi:hypothetical protein